jgi:uncharacterized membrane protein
MIVWGMVAGALLGWGATGLDGDVVLPGLFVGALLGLWLRAIVRKEMASRIAALREDMEDWHVRSVPVPSAVTRPPPAIRTAAPSPAPDTAAAAPTAETVPVERPHAVSPAPHQKAPSGPNLVERLVAAGVGWLLGGNTIVRVGLVILFVGLAFLVHYAANAGLFPIELRLVLVAAVGIALLYVGFARRLAKPDFALSLQGGGIAILYLTVFAASQLYEVIPASAAFPIMIVVCALGCALALLQNSQTLAATSFVGGFAVPVLLRGDGSTLGLFGYYTVLNLAVLTIAWRRSWRIINLVGFFATFGLATAWGVLVYDPEQLWICQIFLILFVLIYIGAAILHARNTPTRLGNVVDSSLLFGPALVGFGLQVGLVRDMPFGSSFSALGFGALYLALAVSVTVRGRGDNRVLTDALTAVAVGFVTLAVPLALGVRWTATVWALEGTAAFWVGMRQARWMPRAFGLLLQVVGAMVFIAGLDSLVSPLPLLNPSTLGAVLIALPGFATAWWLRTPAEHSGSRWALWYEPFERALPKPVFLYAFAFWCLACVLECHRLLPPRITDEIALPALPGTLPGLLTMLAVVASAGLAALVGRRAAWPVATWPSRATLVALALALFVQWGSASFVLQWPHWLIWLAALVLHYRLLRANDRAADARSGALQRAVHIGGVWLLTALLFDGVCYAINRADLWDTSWAGLVLLAGMTMALLVLTLWAGDPRRHQGWPLREQAQAYACHAALPIAALTFAGALVTALFASGQTASLPYVPLLNPVDLMVALALAALVLWRRMIASSQPRPAGASWLAGPQPLIALAALAFIAINTVWLRVAHHLLGVSWSPEALLGSFTVQTGLSILWTLLALGLTLMAHRRGLRTLWLTGGGLLAAVVLKLLLVDLSNADGGARIVTFIVVGVLMLVVGYFAPLPPKAHRAQAMILRRLGLALALLAGAPVAATGGDNPGDYTVRVPLRVPESGPLQRVRLPARVLVASRGPQLADVRVFDAAGRPVPLALAPTPAPHQKRQEVTLPVLPILGAADALAVSGVSLRIDEHQRASVVRLEGKPKPAGASRLLGILLDTRRVADPGLALALDLTTPAGQPVTITIESSADLKDWQTLADKVVYRTNPAPGRTTIGLAAQYLEGRYLRVTWQSSSRLLSPVEVRAASLVTARRSASSGPRAILAMDAGADRHAIEFTLPFPAAITALEITLAGDDTVVPVRVLGRNQSEGAWTPIASGSLFRVTESGHSRVNPAFDLHGARFRSLRVEADGRSPGFSMAPMIAARLKPVHLVFLATSPGPFTLAAGKVDAAPVLLESDDLQQANGASAAAVPLATVPSEADPVVRVLAVDQGTPWRRAMLWGVLLVGTILLAGMVWLLMRRREPVG